MNHVHRQIFVCDGTCGSMVSAEEFTAGKAVCQVDGCTKVGQPFSERIFCEHCGKMRTPEEQRAHDRVHHAHEKTL